jgi:hypothetical protein
LCLPLPLRLWLLLPLPLRLWAGVDAAEGLAASAWFEISSPERSTK